MADGGLLCEIADGLCTLEASAPPILETVLPLVQRLLAAEVAVAYRPAWNGGGWSMDFLHVSADGPCPPLRSQLVGYLGRAPRRFGLYDPLRPERAQRNAVVESGPAGRLPVSFVTEFMETSPLAGHTQLRILVCEGPSLLGWVGAYRSGAFGAHTMRKLSRLAPLLRERLSLDRRLREAELESAGLAAALEAIASPAFIVGVGAGVRHANAGGRALLDGGGGPLLDAVHESLLGRRPAPPGVTLTTLSAPGLPRYVLALVEGRAAEGTSRVARATERWRLTARQAQVLAGVAEGLPNKLIADRLACATRTVEVHLTAIFDKAGVTSRSELVAAMLV